MVTVGVSEASCVSVFSLGSFFFKYIELHVSGGKRKYIVY